MYQNWTVNERLGAFYSIKLSDHVHCKSGPQLRVWCCVLRFTNTPTRPLLPELSWRKQTKGPSQFILSSVQTHCCEATPRYRQDRSRSFDGKVTICCWEQRDPLHSRPTQERQSHRRQNWLLLLYKEPPTLYWRFGPRYKSQCWQMGELPGIEALLWLQLSKPVSRRNRWGCTSSPYTARTKRTSPRCPCHTPPHPQKSSSLVEQSAPNSTQLHPAHLLLAVCSNELPFLPPCQSTATQLWQQQSQNSCCRCKIPRRQAWCTNTNLHRLPAVLFPLHFHFCSTPWLIKLLSQCAQSAVR